MPTYFHSTRGNADMLTSKQAIRQGLAHDGGLFVTDDLGNYRVDVESLQGGDYQGIARQILGTLLPDFNDTELWECIDAAYGSQWDDPSITPLRQLGDDYVLELFHGPTCAFKDVALQMLPRLMARTGYGVPDDANASREDGMRTASAARERIMILTATSGDTGKAALEGFADAPDTGITVFYPEGKVSEVQRRQMTTQRGGNVHVCAVRGNFDDAQSAVKRIFGDERIAADLASGSHVRLSSANSINVGRLVPQVVYYFCAYLQLMERNAITAGDEVEFVVPTGNFGDILAGYYAKRLGLPVARLTVASDRNNVLYDFLTTGTYDRERPFFQTTSPSMDILVSSNLERMLYYMSDGDSDLVDSLMGDLKHRGSFTVPSALLSRIQELFGCGWADEDEVSRAIHDCWEHDHYLMDPHTACGYHVMRMQEQAHERTQEHGSAKARVLLSTASPYKFPRVVGRSIGLNCPDGDFECMDALAQATSTEAPDQLRGLSDLPERFTDVIDIAEMPQYVIRAANTLS